MSMNLGINKIPELVPDPPGPSFKVHDRPAIAPRPSKTALGPLARLRLPRRSDRRENNRAADHCDGYGSSHVLLLQAFRARLPRVIHTTEKLSPPPVPVN